MSFKSWRILIAAGSLLVVAGLFAAACGGDEEEGGGGTGTATEEAGGGGATTVNITATDGDEYAFNLDKTTVPAGEVSFVLKNEGDLEHELLVYAEQDIGPLLAEKVAAVEKGEKLSISSRIDGLVEDAAGEHELEVPAGESGTYTVNLTPGTYELGCIIVETIGADTINHHEKGMKATITVQ